jgi:hypothetical protein
MWCYTRTWCLDKLQELVGCVYIYIYIYTNIFGTGIWTWGLILAGWCSSHVGQGTGLGSRLPGSQVAFSPRIPTVNMSTQVDPGDPVGVSPASLADPVHVSSGLSKEECCRIPMCLGENWEQRRSTNRFWSLFCEGCFKTGLKNYLPGISLNLSPPALCLLSRWEYGGEPLVLNYRLYLLTTTEVEFYI